MFKQLVRWLCIRVLRMQPVTGTYKVFINTDDRLRKRPEGVRGSVTMEIDVHAHWWTSAEEVEAETKRCAASSVDLACQLLDCSREELFSAFDVSSKSSTKIN